jgi:hypothetical protein
LFIREVNPPETLGKVYSGKEQNRKSIVANRVSLLLRWVVFLSGLAHITLPNSTAEAYIPGGKNGAILALDTADVSSLGHITKYPSQESTIALQIPLGQGGIPGHAVLHDGACKGVELQV